MIRSDKVPKNTKPANEKSAEEATMAGYPNERSILRSIHVGAVATVYMTGMQNPALAKGQKKS
jgi:hypothetical protein